MNKAQHCSLCEHQVYDIKTGTKCGLTKQRPNFINSCGHIKFEKIYVHKIKEINTEHQTVLKRKKSTRLKFTAYLTGSLLLMAFGVALGLSAWENRVLSKTAVIIAVVGLLGIPKAINIIHDFRQSMEVANIKKSSLDGILATYNVYYSIRVDFNTDAHGSTSTTCDLQFLRTHFR